MEQAYTPGWVKKMQGICTIEFYSAILNNEIVGKWMLLEVIALGERCQTLKDKY